MNYRAKRRKAQREDILQFIKNYIKEHGYSPSVREIGYAIGYKSTSSVKSQLDIMIALGMIESDAPRGTARAIRVPGMKFVEA
jgi:repressor LexA